MSNLDKNNWALADQLLQVKVDSLCQWGEEIHLAAYHASHAFDPREFKDSKLLLFIATI